MIEPVSARASKPMIVPKSRVAEESCRESYPRADQGRDADTHFEQTDKKKLEPDGAERALENPSSRRSIRVLGDRIALVSAQIQAATYQLLVMIREFDKREGWYSGAGGNDFRSCAHWLNWRTGLDLGAAREKVRVARALGELPLISEAMRRGEISYSKVRALTRVATPENEQDLLGFARAGTASHVEKLVRAWRRVDRFEELELEEKRRASRKLQIYTDEDGMVLVKARLEPEVGAAVVKAIEAAEQVLFERGRLNTPWMKRAKKPLASVAPTRLAWSPKAPWPRGWEPVRERIGYRWSSMSISRSSRMPTSPESRCSRGGKTFPRNVPTVGL